VADHFNSLIVHRNARDVSFAAVSRASSAKIEAFKKRMGWSFQWVSSQKCDFNRDYDVSSTKEEMAMGKVEYNYGPHKFPSKAAPGVSVFYGTQTATSFTPIPHTRAGWTFFWGPITISTWCRRAATKMNLPAPCPG
jgi:predicted dithiol-disulfide oxidoreductase (DUF899 family)